MDNLLPSNGNMYAEQIPDSKDFAYTGRNLSLRYYLSPYYYRHKDSVVPLPKPNPHTPLNIPLAPFVGSKIIEAIENAGEIVFHSVGDTGLIHMYKGINHEEIVSDSMSREVSEGGSNPPAFLYHLGDVVYYFGQRQYYYEQFYEPFKDYDRPIFAIPGNHDGSTQVKNLLGEVHPLQPFLDNFCSTVAHHSKDSGGLARTTMTQPGVYFTLDAPFVSIIGLYTNCLEDSGVISSQGGKFPTITDKQLEFLTSELKRLAPERNAGKRAIILATHAPLFTSTGKYGSDGMVADITACCEAAGLYPDAILSGHVHVYERLTITLPSGQQIPQIISGSGGFALETPAPSSPPVGTTVDNVTLEVTPIRKYGYLTVTTNAKTLTISFKTPTTGSAEELDTVTVDLQTKTISSST
jgi:hypothetical protein